MRIKTKQICLHCKKEFVVQSKRGALPKYCSVCKANKKYVLDRSKERTKAQVWCCQYCGKELNVKAHALLWGAPDHVAFAVLEADSLVAIGSYLNSIAITQEFKITPVENVSDVVEFGKAAIAARAKK